MPSRLTIVLGSRYGRWRVQMETPSDTKDRMFLCECDCGCLFNVYLTALRSGASTQCRNCRDGGSHGK